MDFEEKDENALAMESRIKSPLTWDSPVFAKIIDLRPEHYEDVTRLIKHHYLKEDPMCKAAFIFNDPESVNGYLNLAQVWMKDTTSIVALSAISGRVIGTAIARINYRLDRTNTYSRVQIFQGRVLDEIMHLKSTVVKEAKAYEYFDDDILYRVYLLCCHPSYQNRGLESALLEACVDVASCLNVTAIVGVFTSGLTQSVATSLGFNTLAEIRYSRWIINDRIVFRDPGLGNYSAAYMGMHVPEEAELLIRQEARRALYKKMAENKNHDD